MRLIDADYLKTWFGEKDLYTYDYIVGTINDAPTIKPEAKLLAEVKLPKEELQELVGEVEKKIRAEMAHPEPHWIPCSERLPEVHETGNSFSGVYMQSYPVLVYGVPEGEEECGFHVVTYCDDLNGYTYWSTELDVVTIDEVKAWMPLPEPWKGEEKC